MIPPVWKIEGPFAGVDLTLIILATGVTIGVIMVTAIVARQLAVMQPKTAPVKAAPRATGEFDQWTERPKAPVDRDAEYQSLYGSRPAPAATYMSSRAPAAPPPPLGEVVVNLGAPAAQDQGWVDVPGAAFAPPPPAAVRPPPRPTGPTDEVMAPSHARRGRDTSTGALPGEEPLASGFERSSTVPGALPSRGPPGDPYSPRAPPPPPPPPRPTTTADDRIKVAKALPEGTSTAASAKSAFRAPPSAQTVVGAGATGTKDGETLPSGKKAIRCPKCATVFAGPATRPATVKCPACGTSGTLR
jgi:hypothetical protein